MGGDAKIPAKIASFARSRLSLKLAECDPCGGLVGAESAEEMKPLNHAMPLPLSLDGKEKITTHSDHICARAHDGL